MFHDKILSCRYEWKTEAFRLRIKIDIGAAVENNEMGRVCSTYRERRGAHRMFVGRHEGRRPLGRPRRR
jgi:hypothetical protein